LDWRRCQAIPGLHQASSSGGSASFLRLADTRDSLFPDLPGLADTRDSLFPDLPGLADTRDSLFPDLPGLAATRDSPVPDFLSLGERWRPR
jgi:hypothetical protein